MAARGFKVFPLRPFGKKPAISGFQLVATSDEATIRAWWRDNDLYNVGVLTTDMVVVDIDTKKGDFATQNFQALGGKFDTLIVQTATGGYHAYYEGPDSKLAVDIVPGVDIRSHNGYVVGPGSYVDPSLTDEKDIRQAGHYVVVVDKPIPWVPIDIEALLEPPGRRVRNDFGVELDTHTAIQNAAVWLATAEPAIEGSGGDNQTYQTAVKLVRDYALTVETAFALMLEHWNERCMPPWRADELYRKIENASEYGQGQLGAARPEAFFSGVQVIPVPGEPTAAERGIALGNLLEPGDIKARPWLIDRLALMGEVTLAAAPGAGGKSMILLTAAAHFAAGRDFGPYKLKAPGVPIRSFIYNAEDDLAEQSRRILAICHVFGLDYQLVKSNLCVMDDSYGELCLVTSHNKALTCNERAVQFVIDTAKTIDAKIVILEPLVNLHTCNENDPGEMRFVITTIRRIAREAGAAALIAHHTNKGTGGKGDETGIRGSGAIVNSARIAIMLSGATDDDVKTFGIRDAERYAYVRIDDAKANLFLKSHGAIAWLRWQGQRIASGDILGVAKPVDMGDKTTQQIQFIAMTLHKHMLGDSSATMNRADAVRVLQNADPMYASFNVMAVRRLIEKVLTEPIQIGADTLVMERTGEDGKGDVLIKII